MFWVIVKDFFDHPESPERIREYLARLAETLIKIQGDRQYAIYGDTNQKDQTGIYYLTEEDAIQL